MPHDVIMPKLGGNMEEAVLLQWMKRPGDPVKKGEPLFEVQTDKVNVEVEAAADGILARVLCEPGKSAKVGEVIGIIGAPGSAVTVTAVPPGAQGSLSKAGHDVGGISGPDILAVDAARSESGSRGRSRLRTSFGAQGPLPHEEGRLFSSPAARRLAREIGVDIAAAGIRGTGPDGRIVEKDVRRHHEASRGVAASGGSGVPPRPAGGRGETPLPSADLVPLTPARRLTAQRMAESARTIPHFYLTVDVRAQALVALRERLIASAPAGPRVSYSDLLVKAVALALRKHPLLNASWADGAVRTNRDIHIGLAMASQDGLRVPVLHRADAAPLADIARRRQDLEARCAEGKLTLQDLEGAAFTVSNLGMFGIDAFQALIVPLQAAILAVGRIAERAVSENGQVVARPMMTLTLGADHRVCDGVDAARFLRDLRTFLEAPHVLA